MWSGIRIPMPRDPAQGHSGFRRGRCSSVGAEYFVTICTDHRAAGLTLPPRAEGVLAEIQEMAADGVWRMRCAVIMPDHLHLLVELGAGLSRGKAVARLKARNAAALRGAGLSWERGFFDRRLRAGDDVLDVFLDIFLNPYRAGLCRREEHWPWFAGHPDDWS